MAIYHIKLINHFRTNYYFKSVGMQFSKKQNRATFQKLPVMPVAGVKDGVMNSHNRDCSGSAGCHAAAFAHGIQDVSI